MIYLFLVCLFVNLASANSLAKLLLQTRQNGNQNEFNSYNFPTQPNNQLYAPPLMIQNPLSTCSNHQPFGPQNGLPVEINMDETNQSYLNKILTNPMLQNILNPNNNHFHQNKNDFALHANAGPTPNIVNNYYIIPPECLQGKGDAIEIIKQLVENQAGVCQNNERPNHKNSENERKNMQRMQNRENEERKCPKANKRPHNQENLNVRNQNNNSPQKRKRKNGHQGQNQHSNNQGNQHKDKQVNKNQKVNNNRDTVNIEDERKIPRKRNRTQELNLGKIGNKKRKRPKNNSEYENSDKDLQTTNHTVSSKNNTAPSEDAKKFHQKERPKVTEAGYNKDEDVIQDIHKKFPGIPEDVIRRLLRYLRRQLQNQSSNSDIQSKQCQNTKRDNNRRKTNRSSQNKRRKSKHNTDLAEVAESPIAITTDNSSLLVSTLIDTKEALTQQVENSTQYNEEVKPTTQCIIETKAEETTTNIDSQTPKLGEEDTILDIENDVDDYFPDFRFDKMYISEDDYIRSLRDNRFYYTTDRNLDLKKHNNREENSEIYYEPYEPIRRIRVDKYGLQSDVIEDTLTRPDRGNFNDEIISRDYSGEEIEFHTPPILEYPDFETKPILKYFDVEGPIYVPEHKNINNLKDKSSTYSDAKTIQTLLKNKPKSDNIETIFARSKVVKYGQPEELKEEELLDRNGKSKYDDTFVVYAKSITDS